MNIFIAIEGFKVELSSVSVRTNDKSLKDEDETDFIVEVSASCLCDDDSPITIDEMYSMFNSHTSSLNFEMGDTVFNVEGMTCERSEVVKTVNSRHLSVKLVVLSDANGEGEVIDITDDIIMTQEISSDGKTGKRSVRASIIEIKKGTSIRIGDSVRRVASSTLSVSKNNAFSVINFE